MQRAQSGFGAPARLELQALSGIALAHAGDDAASLIIASLPANNIQLQSGDAIVVAQKLISKCEGRLVALADVVATDRARELAARTGKDPRLVELILRESVAVLRVGREVLIVEHRNVEGRVDEPVGREHRSVQPGVAPERLRIGGGDLGQRPLRESLRQRCGVDCGVLIIDSIGRAWRRGTVGQAIGAAGLPVLIDLRGRRDLHDRVLRSSDLGHADELAAAASLLMGQADEGRPVVLVRGLVSVGTSAPDQTARDLQRACDEDLFR